MIKSHFIILSSSIWFVCAALPFIKVPRTFPFTFLQSKGEGLVFKLFCFMTSGQFSSKIIKSACLFFSKLGLCMLRTFVGLTVNKEIALFKSIIFLCTNYSVIKNKVSIPEAPTDAAEKGCAFVSFDRAL